MSSTWTTVAVKKRLEALFIQGRLQSEGISVHLKGEAMGTVYVFNTGPLGQVEIQVPEEQVARARRVLEELARGESIDGC